jgi:predicted transcriptional regulator
MYSVGLAYLLWFVSGFGALGFHRFYLGKVPTGLLWMFTGGLLMVGSIYDFFTLGRQVKQANMEQVLLQNSARSDPRLSSLNNLNNELNNLLNTPKDSIERIMLKLAKKNNGILTISDVALEANIPVDDAKKELEVLANKGIAEVRVKKTGALVYVVNEYLENASSLEEF